MPMAPVHGNFVRGETDLRSSHSFNHLFFLTKSDINRAEEGCKMNEESEKND